MAYTSDCRNALTEVTKDMIVRANSDLRQLGRQEALSVSAPPPPSIQGQACDDCENDKQDAERVRLTRMTRDFQRLMRRFQDIQLISVEKSREFVVKAKVIAASQSPSLEAELLQPSSTEAAAAPLLAHSE